MAEEKRDWRQASASRGLKLVIYFLPLFFGALYAQSRAAIPLVIQNPTYKSDLREIVVPKAKVLQHGRLQIEIPKLRRLIKKAKLSFKIAGSRETVKKQGLVILGKKLELKDRRLKKDRVYRLSAKLDKSSFAKLKGRSWALIVKGLQPRRDFSVFDMLATLVYPSIIFILIGATMILAPRIVS